jgi:predicted DNA-binding transcriptional regulator AlpA
MNTNVDPLERVIAALGVRKVAEVCGVSVPAVCHWRRRKRLPRTELTGETEYSRLLSLEVDDVSAGDLLNATLRAWRRFSAMKSNPRRVSRSARRPDYPLAEKNNCAV